ncbi:hypothetical protein ACOME3_008547 [Neoechinorhynchus agilis]
MRIFGSLQSASSVSPGETEVLNVPADTISRLQFSPGALSECYLMASSWAGDVACWQVDLNNGTSVLKAQKNHGHSILDCCWSDDGRFAFTAGCDKIVRGWSLAEDKYIQVAAHDLPVKTVNYIKTSSYSCLMTGSWDRTLKFWDLRQAEPIKKLDLGERVYCADVCGPMAVVVTADRMVRIYTLEPQPVEYSRRKDAVTVEGE